MYVSFSDVGPKDIVPQVNDPHPLATAQANYNAWNTAVTPATPVAEAAASHTGLIVAAAVGVAAVGGLIWYTRSK